MLLMASLLTISVDELQRVVHCMPAEDLLEVKEYIERRLEWIDALTDAEQIKMKKGNEELLLVSIANLGLPTRIRNALYHGGLNTLWDIKYLGKQRLRMLPGISDVSVKLLIQALDKRGHRLPD